MESFGRYRVLSEVGRGGVGLVLRALDPQGRPVALKLLLAGQAAPERQRRRFQREAQALLRLRHPGVVALLDAGEQDGLPFLVMEWLEGESLEARLARAGPLPPPQAAALVRDLALALAHCHAQGVLHRDLKPANVFLERAAAGERARLVDFGLTRELALEGEQSVLSRTGQALGTPSYWPPEQAEGRRAEIGVPADVFGLGGLLFAALTGEPPHGEGSALEVFSALSRPPRPPSAVRPGLPPALDALCVACLARDPAARPADAQWVARALEDWLERGERPRRAAGRGLALLLGVSAGAVLALGALLWLPQAEPATAPTGAGPLTSAAPTGAPASAATPTDPASLAALVDAAEGALSADDVPRALQAASAAIVLGPDDPRLLALLAEALQRSRMNAPAEEAARRALALDPGQTRAMAALGEALLSQDRVEEALALADQAVARDPADAHTWALRVRARLRAGDFAGAERDATRLLSLVPDQPYTLGFRADARRRLGDTSGALADADRALVLHPAQPATLVCRGETHLQLGHLAQAIADASSAIALDPNLGAAYLVRGRALERQGRRADARLDLERAAQVDPGDAEARIFLADLLMLMDEPERARRELLRALESAPAEEPRVRRLLAKLALRAGELEQARRELDRALELTPDDPAPWWLRAEVDRQRGDAPAALAAAQRTIELAPDRSDGYLSRAETLLQTGDMNAAREAAVEALAHEHEDAAVQAQCLTVEGSARHVQGDAAGALQCADRALALAPDYARALIVRAGASLDLNRLEDGVRDADRALALTPDSAEAWATRAELRRKQGDRAGAIADATRALELKPGQRAWLTRALARLNDDLPGARDDAGAALELGGSMTPLAALIRGEARRGLGELAAAEADYRRGLELAPDGPWSEQLRQRVAMFERARAAEEAEPPR